METTTDHGTGKRLLIADFFFVVGDFIILFLMLKFWFWLFSNRVILIILILLTLSGFSYQIPRRWGQIEHDWRLYKTK